MMAEKQNRKRERGANYTTEEKTLLADLAMQYKSVIEDKRSGGIYINKKKEAWKTITLKYNSNSTTGHRETEQLKTLYDNMKQKTRKKVGESNKIDYLNRQHLAQLQISDEDLAKALQNVKEDKVQINKTGGGFYKPQTTDSDAKILAIIQDQVKPLDNPFDSGAIYFKDQIDSNPSIQTYDPIQIVDNSTIEVKSNVEVISPHSIPSTLSTITQDPSVAETGDPDQSKPIYRKLRKSKNIRTGVPKKLKRNTSAEALKRIYFKQKCQNAYLERRKLALEILHLKQEHNLKMTILKKQLDKIG